MKYVWLSLIVIAVLAGALTGNIDKVTKSAIDTAYGFIKNIHFENMYYRKDIGHRALKYFS